MKKAFLAFGLVVMSVVSVSAQETIIEAAAPAPIADAAVVVADAVVEAPVVTEVAPVMDGQYIEGAQDATFTAAPADCGCGAAVAAPVSVYEGSVYEAAAPVAGCGCGAAAPVAAPVASCGCAAAPVAAPVASCGCAAAPVASCGCAAPVANCGCEASYGRERKQVVRGYMTKIKGRRSNCCCN